MNILLSIRSKTDNTVREVPCAVEAGLAIGRGAEEGILLDGPDLSREHLLLSSDGNNIFITDLSSNGTWLNGNRLKRSVKVRIGAEDAIEVPGYVLRFNLADQPGKAPAIAPMAQGKADAVEIAPAQSKSSPLAILDLVVGFIGSFSLLEKFLILVGVGGLLLLYAYGS